jgi:hypothetical protein
VESSVKVWVENSYNTTMAVLVDTVQAAGYYQVVFPASGWPSGVYFAVINATPLSGGTPIIVERYMLIIR